MKKLDDPENVLTNFKGKVVVMGVVNMAQMKTNFEKWKETLTARKLGRIWKDMDVGCCCEHCPAHKVCAEEVYKHDNCGEIFLAWANAPAEEVTTTPNPKDFPTSPKMNPCDGSPDDIVPDGNGGWRRRGDENVTYTYGAGTNEATK